MTKTCGSCRWWKYTELDEGIRYGICTNPKSSLYEYDVSVEDRPTSLMNCHTPPEEVEDE